MCADPSEPETLDRELRALIHTGADCPHAISRLLVLNRDEALIETAPGVVVQPAYEWLLTPVEENT